MHSCYGDESGQSDPSQFNATLPSAISEALDAFYFKYETVHGYLSSCISVVGMLTNVLSIVVLTRPKMASTINSLLIAIAVSDTTVMITNLVYMIHYRILTIRCQGDLHAYGWAAFSMVHAYLSVTVRSASLWLSVTMAVLRKQMMSLDGIHKRLKQFNNPLVCIVVVGFLVILMNIPTYLAQTIVTKDSSNKSGCPAYQSEVDFSPISYWNNCALLKLTFWTNGILLKIVPCICLAAFIISLLRTLKMHANRRRQLLGQEASTRLTMPTTPVLIAILLVNILTELPHAFISVMSGIFPNPFRDIYSNLGDVFDLLSLVNCTLVFTSYCAMSKSFRETAMNLVVTKYRIVRHFSTEYQSSIRSKKGHDAKKASLPKTTAAARPQYNENLALLKSSSPPLIIESTHVPNLTSTYIDEVLFAPKNGIHKSFSS